jgi:hypothetical protein
MINETSIVSPGTVTWICPPSQTPDPPVTPPALRQHPLSGWLMCMSTGFCCREACPQMARVDQDAGGLMMEVGEIMTHGSVVVCEFGIPAVVNASQATTRL